MTAEEIELLNQLRYKLQQAELALSDANEFINNLPLSVANREACLINTCLVGEAIADAKDLFEQVETFSTPVTEQTKAMLAGISKPADTSS